MRTPSYNYRSLLDLPDHPTIATDAARSDEIADRALAESYVLSPEIRLRLNLALATGRPLLIRGPSGSGKSSLAVTVAVRAGWSFYELTINSRTQATDLLYTIDYLRRLQDAQTGTLSSDLRPYVDPGPLWWAFNPNSAEQLFQRRDRPVRRPSGFRENAPRALVLIDEVDKADPDLPNNLLVPLGRLAFTVPELDLEVTAPTENAPLVVLTTNEERDLPPAFLRRCIELQLEEPDKLRLIEIGQAHGLALGTTALATLADYYLAAPRPEDRAVNAAEFLDFVRAWRMLELDGKDDTKAAVLEAITHGRRVVPEEF